MLAPNQSRRLLRCVALVLAVAGTFALVSAISACDGRTTPVSNPAGHTRAVTIPVEGMTCAACAARVKQALASMDGVSEVEVSLAERTARVRFDPSRRSPDELVAAIEGLGYPAAAAKELRP